MTNDTVRIMCPNLSCRKVLAVPASARGKTVTVRCRNCSTSIRIPAFPSAKNAAAAAAAAAAKAVEASDKPTP